MLFSNLKPKVINMLNLSLILPSASDIRGARASLDWKQIDLAHKCDVNLGTIASIENEKSKPTKETLEIIAKVFLKEGIHFLVGGGYKVENSVLAVYEGRDAYAEVQEDILRTYDVYKKEVLYLGGDESWSSEKTLEEDRKMQRDGINIKSLIKKGTKHVAWPPETYRAIDEHYLLSDLIVIYADKVMLTADVTLEPYNCKLFVIKDEKLAEKWRQYFYKLWDLGEKVK
jgi:DNA-binding XRE family transcriptional regulator